MHFAISFHTPVIAIFGPTPPNYAVDKNRSPSLIAMRAKAVCPGSNKCTIFNSMDKERAEEIRQICNKKNQICTDSNYKSIRDCKGVFYQGGIL